MADKFIASLADISGEQKESFKTAAREDPDGMKVISRFELSPGIKKKITGAVHKELIGEIDVVYKTDPELITGVELRARGLKASWNMEIYIKAMENQTRLSLEKLTGLKKSKGGEKDASGKEENTKPAGNH